MGRITYETISKPLDQRLNIVLSHTQTNKSKDVIWANSIDKALDIVKKAEEIMIIGGKEIYELFLPIVNRLYLTHIDAKIVGDTYFPVYENREWSTVFIEHHKANETNFYDYSFEILERNLYY